MRNPQIHYCGRNDLNGYLRLSRKTPLPVRELLVKSKGLPAINKWEQYLLGVVRNSYLKTVRAE